MIEPLKANWQTLTDIDLVKLLRNSEGKNSTERALFLEAARRIEARDAEIESEIHVNAALTAAIRARNGAGK